ncbi:hypothetical protein EBB07_11720 [Paenibacillaceae bacterium]|nr:hypothetical protein EBB07_11720 [Paenibacillaceae bacterium]
MQMNKRSGGSLPRLVSMTLAFILLAGSATGAVFSAGSARAAEDTVKAASPTDAQAEAGGQTVAAAAPHKTFPQHVQYAKGTIKPSHVSQAQMDETVIRLFTEWRDKYLKANPYDETQKYVWYSDGDWHAEETDEETGTTYMPITVSEAHGYGMLILALMASADDDTRADFDAMHRYYKAHPSQINPLLMAWQQGDTGSEIIDTNGPNAATDGDMDIAYALLLADRQWGSDGEINYLAEGRKLIDAIMESEVNQKTWMMRLGDWASSGKWDKATRPSDWMVQHMKDFYHVTADGKWNEVVDRTYGMINHLYKNYNPTVGLLPDFVVEHDKTFIPAPPNFLESDNDGDYNYNSARTPWRIGTDYLISGDQRAGQQLTVMNRWIQEKTGGDPANIRAGYKLDGSEHLAEWQDLTFSAPFMVSALIDSSNQEWLNKLWDYNAAPSTEDQVYFSNNIRLLSMIVVSGNWWSPTIGKLDAPSIAGADYAKRLLASPSDYRIRRGELVRVIASMLHLEGDGSEFVFPDSAAIRDSEQRGIGQALAAGIITGYKDGSFRPDRSVKRGELATIILRAAGIAGLEADDAAAGTTMTGFADDNDIPQWSKGLINEAYEQNIIEARDGNNIAAAEWATPAEVAHAVLKLEELLQRK